MSSPGRAGHNGARLPKHGPILYKTSSAHSNKPALFWIKRLFIAGPATFIKTRPTAGDLIGSISVALVLIPQAIAYASIAGLPAETGLFAATIPLMAAAPFVSCPWLQTGPVALTSILTYGALSSIEFASPEERIGAAALLALVVGATRLTLGVCRLGGFTKLLTKPVVLGFTSAAAILIICSQLSKALGTANDESNVLLRSFISLANPGSWNVYEILISIVVGLVAWFGRKVHRLFPSIMVAVVIGMLIASFLPTTINTVGNLPGAFVSLHLNLPIGKLFYLIVPGIVIAFIGFAEPASISMALMGEKDRIWSPNWELCGGGFANLASGLFGGYPVGGSFSRTSINRFAGSTTSWSGFLTGLIVLSLLWATPALASLPESALAAVIIVAVVRLIKLGDMWTLAKENYLNGAVAAFTFIAVLVIPRLDLGVLAGVVVGAGATIWQKKIDGKMDSDS